MADAFPQDQKDPHPHTGEPTYRCCRYCGMFLLATRTRCPECGAEQETSVIPTPPLRKGTFLLWLTILAISGGSLLLLSRDAEEARASESERRNRLHSELLDGQDWGDPSNPSEFLLRPTPKPPKKQQPKPPVPAKNLRPTPTPKPKPTAIPTPTPAPTPAPTATPAPTPTPKPDLLQLRDQFTQDLLKDLDKIAPMYEVGSEVRLTLANGRSLQGTLFRLEPQSLVLEKSGHQKRVLFRELDSGSRIRVDADQRNTYVEEQAIEAALEHMTFPE